MKSNNKKCHLLINEQQQHNNNNSKRCCLFASNNLSATTLVVALVLASVIVVLQVHHLQPALVNASQYGTNINYFSSPQRRQSFKIGYQIQQAQKQDQQHQQHLQQLQQLHQQQQQLIQQRNARYANNLGSGMIVVPGATKNDPARQIILPNENFIGVNMTNYQDLDANSYVIDNKRYVEAVATRCFVSTILEDPISVEPSFVLIRPNSEIRLNATAPIELIKMAGFEPGKRTTIFVHGFTQSYPSTTWLRKVRALFELNEVVPRQNLIIMDWGNASQGSYSQVAARVGGMGSFLAHFIGKLIQLGAERMSIHIIGHSLGAHVAGFAGKRIRPRLGRITGLDAAGPCFGKIFANSAQERLSADDAYQVDVYHYDDNFLGLPGQHGQFDVYVNGGSQQPGCNDDMNAVFQALITMVFRRNRVLSESHTRSTEVVSQQLSLNGCQQVAYECRDYNAFTLGECGQCDDANSQCFFMGFPFQYNGDDEVNFNTHVPLRTSFPGKRVYITTGPNELYCLHHYQVLVRFEATPELVQAAKRNKWRLQLELVHDLQKRVDLSIVNQMAPGVFSYLLLTETQPVRFKGARLQVRAADNSLIAIEPSMELVKKSPFRVLAIEINFMSNVNPNVRRSLSSRLCPLVASAQPPAPVDSNSNAISDSTSGDAWTYFEECLATL